MYQNDIFLTNKPPERSSAVVVTDAYVAVTTANCILEFAAFANTTESAATAFLQAGDDKVLVSGISVDAAKTEYISIPEGGLYMPGGFKVKSGTDEALHGWFRFRKV